MEEGGPRPHSTSTKDMVEAYPEIFATPKTSKPHGLPFSASGMDKIHFMHCEQCSTEDGVHPRCYVAKLREHLRVGFTINFTAPLPEFDYPNNVEETELASVDVDGEGMLHTGRALMGKSKHVSALISVVKPADAGEGKRTGRPRERVCISASTHRGTR